MADDQYTQYVTALDQMEAITRTLLDSVILPLRGHALDHTGSEPFADALALRMFDAFIPGPVVPR